MFSLTKNTEVFSRLQHRGGKIERMRSATSETHNTRRLHEYTMYLAAAMAVTDVDPRYLKGNSERTPLCGRRWAVERKSDRSCKLERGKTAEVGSKS